MPARPARTAGILRGRPAERQAPDVPKTVAGNRAAPLDALTRRTYH